MPVVSWGWDGEPPWGPVCTTLHPHQLAQRLLLALQRGLLFQPSSISFLLRGCSQVLETCHSGMWKLIGWTHPRGRYQGGEHPSAHFCISLAVLVPQS